MTIRPKAYCIFCNEKQNYILGSEMRDLDVRGVSFSYLETTAHCQECGSLIYVPVVNDNNVTARHKAYYNALYLMEEKEHGREAHGSGL